MEVILHIILTYAHLDLEEHSIWETFMFQVATVVVVPIVNANVEAVDDRAFSTYTVNIKH